ncbi:MAG: DUF2892 domain-containing protein [Gammaproteobacteria bacterium]
MQCNIGTTDRVLRLILGFLLLLTGVFTHNLWFAAGVVPIITAAFKWCPFYVPFRHNTDH